MPLSILIADDNGSVRSLLVRLVRRVQPQAQVIDVDTGQAALDQCVQYHPGLVLLDHGLPDIDGFHVLRMLKADANAPYVIVVTGDSSLEQEALVQGADEVWLKPMDVTVLLEHLSKVLPRASR